MTTATRSFAGVASIAVGLSLAAVVLHAGDRRQPTSALDARDLYVTSGSAARRLTLSFNALAADLCWIRTIQHYGRDRKSTRTDGRFELLWPLLNLTTTLDPEFSIAYRFGAVFLAQPYPSGPGRVDQAIALLDKGLRQSPDRWQYAFDIGFIHYWYGVDGTGSPDFVQAADWFARAAAMPRAPVWLRQMAAITRAEGGDRSGARALLQELATSEEEWVRRGAARGLDQLAAMVAIGELQKQVDTFTRAHRHSPSTWADVNPSGPGHAVPVDPAGVPYEYDAASGRVVLSQNSPLYPLPSTLGVK
jgi:hypothetical protein